MRTIRINTDFGSGITIDKRVAESAAKAVTHLVPDKEDATLFLDMLGLIPPQPGYEPNTQFEYKKEQNKKREARKKQEKRYEDIQPFEYGE